MTFSYSSIKMGGTAGPLNARVFRVRHDLHEEDWELLIRARGASNLHHQEEEWDSLTRTHSCARGGGGTSDLRQQHDGLALSDGACKLNIRSHFASPVISPLTSPLPSPLTSASLCLFLSSFTADSLSHKYKTWKWKKWNIATIRHFLAHVATRRKLDPRLPAAWFTLSSSDIRQYRVCLVSLFSSPLLT